MPRRPSNISSSDREALIRLDERYDHLATKLFVVQTVIGALVTYTVLAATLLGIFQNE